MALLKLQRLFESAWGYNMEGTSFKIDWKTTKSGDKIVYLALCDGNRYPIEKLDVDEQGRGLIFFPCTYYPKSLYDKFGEDAEGMFGIIEKLSDCGKVAVVDDDEIAKIYGTHRLMDGRTVVDGTMVFVWDKENSKAHFEMCVKE